MGEQRNGAADPGRDAGRTVSLPDLTDVDLRTLRAMDDPGLAAAVDQVLLNSHESRDVWFVGDDPGEVVRAPVEHPFPVGLTGIAQGEDHWE